MLAGRQGGPEMIDCPECEGQGSEHEEMGGELGYICLWVCEECGGSGCFGEPVEPWWRPDPEEGTQAGIEG